MHAAFGLVAFFFTLSSSIPMLVKTGIIPNTSNISPFVSSNALKNHYLVGITCLVVITVETALGILTKCVNIAGKRSSIVILSKRIHQIFGFIILILCKSNYYIISPGSYLLMVQDAAFVVIIVVWKLYFPKMESAISPKVNNLAEIPSITTLSKLPTDTNYCILANLVYDLAPVKLFHPAGY
jgi:K+ transporter